jgi:D-glycero-D-manno-heptose 1,7-bisphosphate phosphatase
MRTVFVDRDGVINANRPDHVKSRPESEFLLSTLEGLGQRTKRGFNLAVIGLALSTESGG